MAKRRSVGKWIPFGSNEVVTECEDGWRGINEGVKGGEVKVQRK